MALQSTSCPRGSGRWSLGQSGSCWSAGEGVVLLRPPCGQWSGEHASCAAREISDLFIFGCVSGCPGHVTKWALGCRQALTLGFTLTQKGTCGDGNWPGVQCLPCQGPEWLRGPRHGWVPWGCLGSRGEWNDQCPVSEQHSFKPPGPQPLGGRQGKGPGPLLDSNKRLVLEAVTGMGRERNQTCPLPGPRRPPYC